MKLKSTVFTMLLTLVITSIVYSGVAFAGDCTLLPNTDYVPTTVLASLKGQLTTVQAYDDANCSIPGMRYGLMVDPSPVNAAATCDGYYGYGNIMDYSSAYPDLWRCVSAIPSCVQLMPGRYVTAHDLNSLTTTFTTVQSYDDANCSITASNYTLSVDTSQDSALLACDAYLRERRSGEVIDRSSAYPDLWQCIRNN